MSTTVADHAVARLLDWGVHRVFGYPGDGITGLVAALARAGERIEYVQAPHEELAAFMAVGHAKFTGEVGVCVGTSGPGAIHLLNGLYDARADHQPVLALVGQQARSALGGDYQQEVDLAALFKDVARDYVHTMMVPEQARHLVDRAMRIARDRRTVTCLVLPNDVQVLPAAEPQRQHGSVHTGIGRTAHAALPPQAALRDAADVLNAGQRVALLVGAGALQAGEEVLAVADRVQAGIAKALLGKMVVPDHLPYVTGSIGILGTLPSWKLMNRCDTLLIVGSSFPYAEFLPPEGRARGVQIDLDPTRLSLRYPTEVNLAGDSAATLRALLPLLAERGAATWRDEIARDVADWWQALHDRAMQPGEGLNPQRVFWELAPRLPDDAMITCDSGTSAIWYARDVKARAGMMGTLSGGLASMGNALPYAIAAKLAHPERPALALVGDGAMQMNGLNALLTVARQWRHWADPRLVVLVLDNGDLNMVTWEQRTAGVPKFAASQDVPRFDYAAYAGLLGLHAIRVEAPRDLGAAWDAAFAADRPTVLQAVVDAHVPPLPPHIDGSQARAYASALLHGDPDAWNVVVATFRQWWSGR